MPETPEAFLRRLERQQALPPVCLIAGEEPLLQCEASDAWREAARQSGFSEREVFDVDSNFDWGRLNEAAASMSIFGDRRLLELRMPNGKPGNAGSRAIQVYCSDPPDDALLLVTSNRLDKGARESAWVKAIEQAGVFVYCWPLPLDRMSQWVRQRLERAGLKPDSEAVELIVERAEGNLLAVDQAVERLLLLNGKGPVGADNAALSLADSARYSVDDLADAALNGDLPRAHRILEILEQEGTGQPLILWALARDIRAAARLSAGADDKILYQEKIFKRRSGLLKATARRQPTHTWHRLLRRCHEVDCAIKGVPGSNPQEALRALVSRLARAASRR
ncbi:DNA polymerase III subunit delta [Halorhodospira halochloris]|uniref:DNA polymerase III subunit delta n=1 Tax=Halorhodospira halochloris TaxID=1052 RepID=UPI001EE94CA9|nr:DNA polymerase III subunit delta [Halorhodospira halochloris]MCG5548099.1 DNA polymerase III subunit delta [Halorhodospira halochloris]